MSSERIPAQRVWTCDRCGRTTEEPEANGAPAGWWDMQFLRARREVNRLDLCADCGPAVELYARNR